MLQRISLSGLLKNILQTPWLQINTSKMRNIEWIQQIKESFFCVVREMDNLPFLAPASVCLQVKYDILEVMAWL
jgi:hypothetical protein